VISAQGDALLAWFHGTDAAGRKTSEISAPTLVADGAEDQLDAVSNSQAIAGLIPGAKLLIYPDAGHGFLFQEGTPFAVTVEAFLSGPPRPVSTATIRAEFLAGEAGIIAAGKTWEARIKGMLSTQPASSGIGGGVSARPTAAQVAGIDEPFASAFTDLDYQLLMAGATGAMGDAITTFVVADEKVAEDVLALAGLSGPTAKTWTPTIKTDSDAEQTAKAALRKALGLPPAT